MIHFGSPVSTTEHDPNSPSQIFEEAAGTQAPRPLFENLSGCGGTDTGALLSPEGEPTPRCLENFF